MNATPVYFSNILAMLHLDENDFFQVGEVPSGDVFVAFDEKADENYTVILARGEEWLVNRKATLATDSVAIRAMVTYLLDKFLKKQVPFQTIKRMSATLKADNYLWQLAEIVDRLRGAGL